MNRISKTFYLGSTTIGFLGYIVLQIVSCFVKSWTYRVYGDGKVYYMGGHPVVKKFLQFGSWGLLLFAFIVFLILLYKMWVAIHDNNARITPGKAVVLVIIPLLNLYWIFQAVWGWSKDYNNFISKRGLNVPQVSEKLALVFCILFALYFVPFLNVLNVLMPLPFGVVAFVFLNQAIDGINNLSTSSGSHSGEDN